MSNELDKLRQQLKDVRGKSPQFLDVKHRNDVVSHYRSALRQLINDCRDLEHAQENSIDPLDRTFLGYDILFLKKQIKERYHHYKTVMHDAFELHDLYTGTLATGKENHPILRNLKPAVNTNKKAA